MGSCCASTVATRMNAIMITSPFFTLPDPPLFIHGLSDNAYMSDYRFLAVMKVDSVMIRIHWQYLAIGGPSVPWFRISFLRFPYHLTPPVHDDYLCFRIEGYPRYIPEFIYSVPVG